MPIQRRGRSGTRPFMLLMKIIFPIIILVWFLFFTIVKASAAADKKDAMQQQKQQRDGVNFRGSSDKSGRLTTTSGSEDSGSQTLGQHRKFTQRANHAIIVAGHAVMNINKLKTADKDDSAWYLLSYQLKQGFPAIITSHIKKGIQITRTDSRSVLIFSGGQTRKDVGPISEAASYYFLAKEKKWMDAILSRVYLEEFARDSYENLLFSLCRFKEVTGSYPSKVTVVGFNFKSSRFVDLHRKAVGISSSNFTYIGNAYAPHPHAHACLTVCSSCCGVGMKPSNPEFDHKKAADGERAAVGAFKKVCNLYEYTYISKALSRLCRTCMLAPRPLLQTRRKCGIPSAALCLIRWRARKSGCSLSGAVLSYFTISTVYRGHQGVATARERCKRWCD